MLLNYSFEPGVVFMKIPFLVTAILLFNHFSFSQPGNTKTSFWRAVIKRSDGNNIVFNFEKKNISKRTFLYIRNASERILVDSVRFKEDSVFIKMPVFESAFKAKVTDDKWDGNWTKGTTGKEQVLPFTAQKTHVRFEANNGAAKTNITGRWAVKFAGDKSKEAVSIAEFRQQGNKLTGTFITPTGDDRFLEGIVSGNKLQLSAFDGGHAILFTGDITNHNQIINGAFFSGATYKEAWTAVRNANATVEIDESAMYLKPGEERLNFRFPDTEGKLVSINDPRFKNKVVVIQIMGSWCPNCMDETRFLSDYYNNNKQRGVEMVALAYEYSADFKRSQQSLKKFQQRFAIQYPVLITGVTVSDSLRTEKTLPQVTPIKVFPSSIILDKSGKVRKLDNSFFGPGTGEHYEAYKKDFYETMNKLLQEK